MGGGTAMLDQFEYVLFDRLVIDPETQQHTLGIEIRIADQRSWHASECKGETHHDAYKFRQLIALMNRLFRPLFQFPRQALPQLRKDQGTLFS